MEIGNIERVMAQIVRDNEKKNGKIKFKIGETEIESEIFTQANGFLPLLVIISQSLEMMMGKRKWSEELFDIQEDESGYLHKKVAIRSGLPNNTPINTVLMSLSASTGILLDEGKNPYIKLNNEENIREVDLVAMLADMSKITVATTSKALSISPDVLSNLYEDDEMEMSNAAGL